MGAEKINLTGIFGVENTAEGHLSDGRYYCRKKADYFETMLYLCSVVYTDKVGTMAISKHMVVYVNPKWILGKTIEELGAVWAHELMHPLLNHAARVEAEGYDPKISNVAGDLAINSALVSGNWEVPADGVFPKSFGFPEALSMDDYYALLVKKFGGEEKAREALSKPGGGKTAPQVNKNGQNSQAKGQGQGQGQPSPGQGQNGGQGGGQGGAGDGQRGHAGDGDCGGCAGNPIEGLEEDQHSPLAKSQDTIDIARGSVAEAINQRIAEKGQSSVPALLGRWAELQKRPALVPWQRVLARSLRRAVEMRRGDADYTYHRPSRKQVSIDESLEAMGAMGSAIRPSMFSPVPRVDIGVDTSGSMGSEELSQCAGEIDGILRTLGGDTEVGIWACDCVMQSHKRVRRASDAVKVFKGGGGTSFLPFFEHMLKQRHNRPGVIVILTDGQGPAPAQAPKGVDVIWVLIGPYRTAPTEWGQHIFVGGNQ